MALSGINAKPVKQHSLKQKALSSMGVILPEKTFWKRWQCLPKDILEALAMLAERMSIAAVARVKGVKADTVSSWLREAASNVEEIEEALLKDYHVDKAQMDSLWTCVGNKGKKGAMKSARIKAASGVER